MPRARHDRLLAIALVVLAAALIFGIVMGLDEHSLRCARDDGGGITCEYTRRSPRAQADTTRTLRLGDPEFTGMSCFVHSGKQSSHCGIGIATADGRFYELFDPDGTREDFQRLAAFFERGATERTIEARRAAMSPFTVALFALLTLGALWGAVRLFRGR